MHITVRVVAESKNESIVERSSNSFIVTVREKAKNNQANVRMRELVAEHLKISKGLVHIVGGHHTPHKILEIKE